MNLWTVEHLFTVVPTFALMIAFSVLMRKLLINKSYEKRMMPIKIISVILVIIEVGKQICSIALGYDLYHIPLHFCSIFLYVLPLMAFYRGKYKDCVRSVACSTMTALFIGMLTIPNVIYSASRIKFFFVNYLDFHSVFFHNIVMLALFLTLSLDLHKPVCNRSENAFVAIFGTGFVAVAAIASHLLQTNYSNFLRCTVGFVAELVEKLKLVIGELPTTVIYTAALALLHVLIMLLANYLFMLACVFKKRMQEKSKKSIHPISPSN